MCIYHSGIRYYFTFAPATIFLTQFLTGKLKFYSRVLKPTAYVTPEHKAADEIRITIVFSNPVKQINK
jgi:hypothetical protein